MKEFIADHMAVESSESIIYCIFIIVHDLFFPPKLLREGGREGGELWLAWPPKLLAFLSWKRFPTK